MSRNELMAVRAYLRIVTPIGNALHEMAACDRQFDGGEWSDRISAATLQESEEDIAKRVGARFGFDAEYLLDLVAAHGNREFYRFLKAQGI